MHLAVRDVFVARWTEAIHDEWTRNVLLNRPDLKPAQLARTRTLMDSSVLDCVVTGYEDLTESVSLPDYGDRHVLAAAMGCEAEIIVTFNLKDFPTEVLKPFGIEAQHPD